MVSIREARKSCCQPGAPTLKANMGSPTRNNGDLRPGQQEQKQFLRLSGEAASMDRWPAYRSTAHVLFLEHWSSLQNERLAVIQHLWGIDYYTRPIWSRDHGSAAASSNRCRREGLRAWFRRPRLAAIGEYHRSFRQSGREHVGPTDQGGKYNPGWYQSPKAMTENRRTKRFTSPTDPAVIRLSLVEIL